MKKYLTCAIIFLSLELVSCAEDDEPEWKASEVCPEAGTNRYGMPNRGTFTDERDGRVYKYTTIGDQVWMAENLKYDAPYSLCPNGEKYAEQYCFLAEQGCNTPECCMQNLCELFGRYYSIIENGENQGLIDRALADTICPKGWHIPTKEEIELLFDNMRGDDNEWRAADRMKISDTNMFVAYEILSPGTDDCGLSFIMAGYYRMKDVFQMGGANILSTTQVKVDCVWGGVVDNRIGSFVSDYRSPIRCLKD